MPLRTRYSAMKINMQKHHFVNQIKQNLTALLPFSNQEISVNSTSFSKQTESVAFFIHEIEKTLELLVNQNEVLYSEFYADKMIKQFDALNQAVEKSKKNVKRVQFSSSFQFSANVHRLSPNKRLQEYRKALRALNEKISWLVEQNYNQENLALKQELQYQIAETEYRKMKCLKAIEDLEQELQFKAH